MPNRCFASMPIYLGTVHSINRQSIDSISGEVGFWDILVVIWFDEGGYDAQHFKCAMSLIYLMGDELSYGVLRCHLR